MFSGVLTEFWHPSLCRCNRSTKQQLNSWKATKSEPRLRSGGKLWMKRPSSIKRWEQKFLPSSIKAIKWPYCDRHQTSWQTSQWKRAVWRVGYSELFSSVAESSVSRQAGQTALWRPTTATGKGYLPQNYNARVKKKMRRWSNIVPYFSTASPEWGKPSQTGGVCPETGGHEKRYAPVTAAAGCRSGWGYWAVVHVLFVLTGFHSHDRARDGAEAQERASAHRGRV